MAAIKRFFEKKKLETKFKMAGAGHSLNESPSDSLLSSQLNKTVTVSAPRQQPADSRAGDAALARLQAQSAAQSKKPSSKTASWKKQMIAEDKSNSPITHVQSPKQTTKVEMASTVVEGVHHICPVCPSVLPFNEIQVHLHDCLKRELEAEPLMISVSMIHTLNKDKAVVDNCVHILGQYLQNIIDHSDQEKYRKIRKNNKAFVKKVASVIGAEEFLLKGCEFELTMLPFENGGETTEQEFYVLKESLACNSEQLIVAKQMLNDAEPIEIHLDRNMKLFEPSQHANVVNIPSSFFVVSSAEVKKEQIDKCNNIEKAKQLRTKAMREAEHSTRKYLYTVIRVRFPDGILLQGTFSCRETLRDVKSFIQEQLCLEWVPFNLVDSIGKPFTDESVKLSVLKLVPSAVLNFCIDSTVSAEIAAASVDGKIQYIKDEHLVLIQQL